MKNKTQIYVLANGKGGVGKSTLARSFAAYWQGVGNKVAIIDIDPQRSLTKRHDPNTTVIEASESEEEIVSIVDELKEDYSILIIDTPGFLNNLTLRALSFSDVAVIPLKAAADDLEEAINTFNLVQEVNESDERKELKKGEIKTFLLLAQTTRGTVIARHFREEIKKMGAPLLKSEMYARVAYPEAAITGLAPNSTNPEGAAARDIADIVLEIKRRMK